MRGMRHAIEDSELLTCSQISLDRESHHAHKTVIAEFSVSNPYLSQLWDWHRAISF